MLVLDAVEVREVYKAGGELLFEVDEGEDENAECSSS